MMMALQIYEDSTLETMVYDWSARVLFCVMTTGEHGDESLEFSVRLRMGEIWTAYDNMRPYYVVLSDNAGPVWQGTLESASMVDGALSVIALGNWVVLNDAPYTAFWSDTRYGDWFVPSDDDINNRTPEKYQTDTNNRLYATCIAGETYTNNADATGFIYRVPHRNRNDVLHISFDYEADLPTNWKLQTVVWDDALTSETIDDTVTSAGSPVSGSKSISLTSGHEAVEIVVYNSTGGNSSPTGDNGTNYIKITNLRVKGTTSSSVYADEVVEDIVSFINGLNSARLSSETGRIQSPSLDLPVLVLEDDSPADILTSLAALGDNSTPPEQYEVGVEDGIHLYFRPRGERSLTWYANDVSVQIERTLENMFNSAYAVYKNERGEARRTAVNTDTFSPDLYNVTRRTAVSVNSSSDSFAQTLRDVAIEDGKTAPPRASVRATRVQSVGGTDGLLESVRAGDEFVLRHFPTASGSALDKVRHFRISRTRLDVMQRILDVIPEEQLPELSVLVSQAQQVGRKPQRPILNWEPNRS